MRRRATRCSLANYTDGRTCADVAFSPDGKRLAACGLGREIRIWDVASRETPATWPSDSKVRRLPGLQPGRQTPGDGGHRRDGGAVGHRDGSEGPDLQRALRTRPRDRLQSGRHAPGHGERGRHPAPLGHDRTAGRRFHPQGRAALSQGMLRAQPRRPDSPDGFRMGRAKAAPVLGHRDGRAARRPDRASAARGEHGLDRRRQTSVPARTPPRPSTSWTSRPARWSARSRSMPKANRLPHRASVPTRNGAPTAGPVARSRCGMPRPAPYSARSGDSTAGSGPWRSVRTARGCSEPTSTGLLKIWDIATGREIAATTLPGVLIRSPGSARTGSAWPSRASSVNC